MFHQASELDVGWGLTDRIYSPVSKDLRSENSTSTRTKPFSTSSLGRETQEEMAESLGEAESLPGPQAPLQVISGAAQLAAPCGTP